jgi:predicted permease
MLAMMDASGQAQLVSAKIAAMLLIIAVGWLCRRGRLFSAETTSAMARFTTDITLPILIFFQMVDTVDVSTLRSGWLVPVLACVVIAAGNLVGWLLWRMFASREQAPVFILVSGVSNWIYLCLPIAEGLYGKDGLRNLFLANVGVQLLFWTLGVAILHGGRLDTRAMRNLIRNPGLIATFVGITVALAWKSAGLPAPAEAAQEAHWATRSFYGGLAMIAEAMRLIGSVTIPLSLVVTGAQIAGATLLQNRPVRALAGVVLVRLVIVPPLVVGLLALVGPTTGLSPVALMVLAIIGMMPVSVTTAVLADRFGEDTSLAAQAILWTTLLSIVTVTPLFALARWMLAG